MGRVAYLRYMEEGGVSGHSIWNYYDEVDEF